MGFLSRIRRLISGQPPLTGGIAIYAPVSGDIVAIEKVPDVVFAEKIVGDGIAIDPKGEFIVAPIDGTIGKIFETNHAFSIESPQGLELFVHFGVGTVELRGNGFKRLAEEGQQVKAGEAILSFDLAYLRGKVDSLLTPVVLANMEDVKQLDKAQGSVVAGKDIIFTVQM
ncbi:PTS glucose transporter subunit IIA [Shewanella sp. SR43-4]|jgi:PTS system glucose-specific IIA component|uniref:PTS glucose transporter subunit IIA n=1 Tax=Shewanella TaxID=22 RepID=UPI000C678206|nr:MULTISPECIES: PTS glucose transporter subunit IIA [Shewanella]NCQ43731.1 PTS glucose transporter subunit IIA [Shewanella frigidimarina]MBB1316942.1 PTS glucose transporter subunit IIA [Shewanella sp. SR43-4]NCO70105.1 PTS glucose transporter subunit IIA [Shewanella vesiculosa]NCP35645.1 PTS glucose transporter subunit IIA [Shewanella vesiculosa]NCP68226.1 PTS glucose transporter subunit IIA [Shewanella vesiculosa]|tara:strand:+ start:13342 stop:13851 length:510 start_codon:yes stop_codon:yes gene_type:complete